MTTRAIALLWALTAVWGCHERSIPTKPPEQVTGTSTLHISGAQFDTTLAGPGVAFLAYGDSAMRPSRGVYRLDLNTLNAGDVGANAWGLAFIARPRYEAGTFAIHEPQSIEDAQLTALLFGPYGAMWTSTAGSITVNSATDALVEGTFSLDLSWPYLASPPHGLRTVHVAGDFRVPWATLE